MITDHPTFIPPDNKEVGLWRYMDLSKFVWTLQNGALYFCRSDLLGDPYEGYYPKTLLDSEPDFVREISTSLGSKETVNPEQLAREMFKNLLALPKKIRSELFVSCWHMNENDSAAMWKLYTSHNESVCVRSRYSVLAELLSPHAFLGKVKYIDYFRDYIDTGNLLNYIVHKRRSFEHERELRAVIWRPPGGAAEIPFKLAEEKGLVVPVDLNKLIEEVYVSPNSDVMFREIVEGLTKTYGLPAPVKQSDVNAPPSY